MHYLVGDIGNTLTKISILNKNFKIIKSFNIETNKLIKSNNLKLFFNKIMSTKTKKKFYFLVLFLPFIRK